MSDSDFTLEKLWSEGVDALQQQGSRPGITYEVAPDIVGKMPWPTLADRERFAEQGGGLGGFFREDATEQDFRYWRLLNRGVDFENLPDSKEDLPDGVDVPIEELERLGEEATHPVREGVTLQEFTQRTVRVNCERVADLLEFEKDVEPSDIVPDMAAVVVSHFTNLGPGSSGPASD